MESITSITGGVCAAKGFRSGGVHCGIAKSPDKKDLALIASDTPCACGAVYTTNKARSATVEVTKLHLADGMAQAIICNSGNANACTADGEEVARAMCELAGTELGISPKDVVVASTGVIGQPLDIAPIAAAMPALAGSLGEDGSRDSLHAIMTTDTAEKEIAVTFEIGGVPCRLGGIAKGSGMIHPNMATMLAFLTTDAAISPMLLQQAVEDAAKDTFNMVSVDGDTSTNDMMVVMANGLAQNPRIEQKDANYDQFVKALLYVCIYLARMMAKDGEGATKLLECGVTGAPTESGARVLAKAVITSSLFKAAMFGADANWGRVLCALGYAPVEVDLSKTGVSFASAAGEVTVCQNGVSIPFSEEKAKEILTEDEIEIRIALNQGEGQAVAWGCDLTYDYVKINGDYRS